MIRSFQCPLQRVFFMDGPQYEVMLLVFDKPSRLYFQMKNTLLSMMAVYITVDGLIFNL